MIVLATPKPHLAPGTRNLRFGVRSDENKFRMPEEIQDLVRWCHEIHGTEFRVHKEIDIASALYCFTFVITLPDDESLMAFKLRWM